MTSITVNDRSRENVSVNTGSRLFAGFFSYLFHPVFLPIYICFFLVYIHPTAFPGFSVLQKKQTMMIVLLNLVFFPLITVLLLKAVGFIDSLYLRTQKDRIIPYIASGIFFFWAYTVFKQQPQYSLFLTSYVLGIFLASSAALIANIYLKVSMHAIGMGGWLGIFAVIFYSKTMLMTWPLAIVIILTGFVCTSRLLTKSHTPGEVYLGLFIGLITQFCAAFFIL